MGAQGVRFAHAMRDATSAPTIRSFSCSMPMLLLALLFCTVSAQIHPTWPSAYTGFACVVPGGPAELCNPVTDGTPICGDFKTGRFQARLEDVPPLGACGYDTEIMRLDLGSAFLTLPNNTVWNYPLGPDYKLPGPAMNYSQFEGQGACEPDSLVASSASPFLPKVCDQWLMTDAFWSKTMRQGFQWILTDASTGYPVIMEDCDGSSAGCNTVVIYYTSTTSAGDSCGDDPQQHSPAPCNACNYLRPGVGCQS